MRETHESTFTVPPGHPSLPGHFPGGPIVPGVVLLDEVFRAARAAFGLGPVAQVIRSKFVTPVLPGRMVFLRLTRIGDARLAFECSVDGAPALSGEAEFAATEPR